MLIAHEPARRIGADRENCQAERTIKLARFAEMVAVAIAAVGDMQNAAGRRLNHEAGPERLVAIEQAARRPMPHWHHRHRDIAAQGHAHVPVIGLDARRGSMTPDNAVVPERRDDPRAVRRRQSRQGGNVEMVVVAMGDERHIDRRQRIKGDSGIVDALRSRESHRRGTLGPDRINEDVQAAGLEQQACVSYERDAPVARIIHPLRRLVGKGTRIALGPRHALPGELPANEVGEALGSGTVGIKEA